MALPNADFGAVFACISFAYNSNASKTGFSCSSRFSYLNTLAEYVERIFTEHFEGGQISMKAERTLAVQIPAELFERLKEYLAARNLKQKQFLIQLIENALDDTEAE